MMTLKFACPNNALAKPKHAACGNELDTYLNAPTENSRIPTMFLGGISKLLNLASVSYFHNCVPHCGTINRCTALYRTK
jgi:hypothetical protein